MSVADTWCAARPPAAGIHVDSVAARREGEVGGYVAAEARTKAR